MVTKAFVYIELSFAIFQTHPPQSWRMESRPRRVPGMAVNKSLYFVSASRMSVTECGCSRVCSSSYQSLGTVTPFEYTNERYQIKSDVRRSSSSRSRELGRRVRRAVK